jgi:ankyrin repeat protein
MGYDAICGVNKKWLSLIRMLWQLIMPRYTIMTASTNGQLDMIKLLLSHGSAIGVDVNQLGTRGDTTLMVAAQANHADVLETWLIRKPMSKPIWPNIIDEKYRTDCTARLISAGSDPLIIDNNGNTALTMAATEETLEMIQW